MCGDRFLSRKLQLRLSSRFNIEGRVGVKTSKQLGLGIDISYNTFSLRQTSWIKKY